ncbi:MAG: site-specific integrase [Planctomycetales bacterium]|nr:site-specific integrase [Planctomycetales bacterium]
MASLHQQRGNRPGYKLRWREESGRQRVLWLGDVSKRSANEIARHVTELAEAHGRNVQAAVDSIEWANNLTGRIRLRLAELGYVAPERRTKSRHDDSRLCKTFFTNWIESRTDLKWRTRNNYEQARDAFIRFADDKRLLTDVTLADIDAWRLWMLSQGKRTGDAEQDAEGYALATANKHLKRIRTLFAQAVRAKLITENPASDIKAGGELNRTRDHYIDGPTAEKFLTWCDTNGEYEWALVFAMARFGGMRPCEMLTLTWRDVDWAEERLRIDSPKTGLRFCPLFPALRPHLDKADELARPGAIKVLNRDSEANLGTELVRKLAQRTQRTQRTQQSDG